MQFLFSRNSHIKVAIVRPPAGYATGWKPNIQEGLYLLPQALVYLGAAAEKAGALTRIFDVEAKEWDLPTTIQRLCAFEPDLVCITTTSVSFCYAEVIAIAMKASLPESVIVMGGSHPTYDYVQILRRGIADVVVRGEGERALMELIRAMREGRDIAGIPGLAYKRNGEIRKSGPAIPISYDEIPMPAYHLVEEIGLYKDILAVTLESARGCPYRCIFCLNNKMYGGSIRYKPMHLLTEEIRLLKERYGIEEFNLVDPTFSMRKERVLRFCQAVKNLDILWGCQTRVDLLTEDLVLVMAESGCKGVLFGIESGTQRSLEVMNKETSVSQAERAVALAGEYGIHVTPSHIMGFPGESREDIEATIRFASHLKERYDLDDSMQFNTLAPFPGTHLATNAESYGIRVKPVDYAFYTVVPVVETDHLPYKVHLDCWHLMWKTFFPQYYRRYLEIENYAMTRQNPKFKAFVGDASDIVAFGKEVNRGGQQAEKESRVFETQAQK